MIKKATGLVLIFSAILLLLVNFLHNFEVSATSFIPGGEKGKVICPLKPQGIVRINEAPLEDLIQLPGIGETLGHAILDEISANGIFHYPEDLMAVRGIGQNKLEQIRPWLNLD